MSGDDFFRTLNERMDRKPFKAFVLEMGDGTRIEIDRPDTLAFREGGATGIIRGQLINLKSVDVKQIVDAATPTEGMAADLFFNTLKELLNREPFQPFVVELNNGSRIEFDRPKSLAIRGGVAGGFARGDRLVLLESANVKQIVESSTAVSKEG